MVETENIGSFIKENKKLAKEYIDVRLEIYRLKLIRVFSKTSGYFIWIMISLFLVSLFAIFLGVVAGLWLSELTGSYVLGFGIVTLLILVKIIFLALFRKKIFVNPIIRNIISRMDDDSTDAE